MRFTPATLTACLLVLAVAGLIRRDDLDNCIGLCEVDGQKTCNGNPSAILGVSSVLGTFTCSALTAFCDFKCGCEYESEKSVGCMIVK